MSGIRYAQCWEDPRVLRRALAVSPGDDVVSIASGGDNTLALLLDNPRSITAVDYNLAQLCLVELKACAIRQLDYDDFVNFVGARPCAKRVKLYRYVRPLLTATAGGYWDRQSGILKRGIIHSGKFERYFSLFRRLVLPLIHRPETVRRLLACSSLGKQQEFYRYIWDNRRWRGLFKVFFGKWLLGGLGRDHSLFKYVARENIGQLLLNRARSGLTEVPVKGNYFLEYILTGEYADLQEVHPYLKAANFYRLRENLGRLRLVHAGLTDHLRTLPPRTVAEFNLSDIFEYMSATAVEATLREIVRVSRENARLAFWTLFVPQALPVAAVQLCPVDYAVENIAAKDRGFFYESFHLWQKKTAGLENKRPEAKLSLIED